MKKIKIIISALCCMLISVSAFAASSNVNEESKIKEFKLKNGIPVYYIENTDNEIDHVSIVVKGGRTYLKPEESGLEQALFSMMTRGSAKYNFIKRQQISYEKSVSVFHDETDNASVLSLQCVNYYLKDMLPLLTDGFMKPVFPKQVYDYMMSEFSMELQSKYNDPRALLKQTANDIIYKNHPYEADVDPRPDTLQNITIKAMKDLHKSILDSRRICVIAVCSLDSEDLLNHLNSTIGTIKALSTALPQVQINPPEISGDAVVITHPSSTGSGYALYTFQAPSIKDEDYYAAKIAADIYSTNMFNIVRSKNGACYSTGSLIQSSEANYGGEYFLMISNPKEFAKFAVEARKLMAEGKYVEKLNDDGSYELTSIDGVLEGSKNALINSIYSSTVKTGGKVAQYCLALVDYDDINAYESMIDKIHAVTADDVLKAFNKYWIQGSGRWFAVVGPESENEITFQDQ